MQRKNVIDRLHDRAGAAAAIPDGLMGLADDTESKPVCRTGPPKVWAVDARRPTRANLQGEMLEQPY